MIDSGNLTGQFNGSRHEYGKLDNCKLITSQEAGISYLEYSCLRISMNVAEHC